MGHGEDVSELHAMPGSFWQIIAESIPHIVWLRTEVWEDEFRIVLASGEERWLKAHTKPILGDAGEVVRIHGTSQDLTERRLAEERLRFQANLGSAPTTISPELVFLGERHRARHHPSGREDHPPPIVSRATSPSCHRIERPCLPASAIQ